MLPSAKIIGNVLVNFSKLFSWQSAVTFDQGKKEADLQICIDQIYENEMKKKREKEKNEEKRKRSELEICKKRKKK